MGLFSGIGKSAGRIVGVDAIKAGGEIVGGLGKTVLAKSCPKCAAGKMFLDEDDKRLHVCSECGYKEPVSGATEVELQELREHAKSRFQSLQPEDIEALLRGHRNAFRIYLSVAVFAICYALYILIFSDAGGILLSVAGFGWLFLVLALKSSYRHWQVRTQTVFQEGSFQRWFKQGDWFV